MVAASEPFDGLEIHHVPQAHPAEQVIPGYERRTGTAIAIPEDIHRVIPRIRGPYAGTPQELIALGLRQLEASVPAEDIAILAARIHDTYDLP